MDIELFNLEDIKFTKLPCTNARKSSNPKGPTKGEIINIFDLANYVKTFNGTTKKSNENPCLMAINQGIRVDVKDITPEMFSNIVFVDIDHIAGIIDVDKILNEFTNICSDIPQLLAAQKSNSGNLHFIFLDKEFTTAEEYKDTAKFYLCLIVYYIAKKFDEHIEDIEGAMDESMNNISHLMKITKNKLYYNPYANFATIPDKVIENVKNYFPNMFIKKKIERPDYTGHKFKYILSNSSYSEKYHHPERMHIYHECMLATNFNEDETNNLFKNVIAPKFEIFDKYSLYDFQTEPDRNKWFEWILKNWGSECEMSYLSKFGVIVKDITLEEFIEEESKKIITNILKNWKH